MRRGPGQQGGGKIPFRLRASRVNDAPQLPEAEEQRPTRVQFRRGTRQQGIQRGVVNEQVDAENRRMAWGDPPGPGLPRSAGYTALETPL